MQAENDITTYLTRKGRYGNVYHLQRHWNPVTRRNKWCVATVYTDNNIKYRRFFNGLDAKEYFDNCDKLV